jgi:hypothetical protein
MLIKRSRNGRRWLALALAAFFTALMAGRAAAEEKKAGFTLTEFNELKPVLDLKNQPWTTIPWKYSITEARKLAAQAHKPIFMVINTGNCLGNV